MEKVKIGIVGLGRLGTVHARNLSCRIPGAELVAACTRTGDRHTWAQSELEIPHLYTDFHQMVDAESLDAVVIVSPSPQHCEMIEYALQEGLHVFCEKPLGCSPEECRRAERAVEAHPNQVFFLGFMRRFDPSYADAKARLATGQCGTPYLIKATSLDPEAVIEGCIRFSATSGGIFIDAASHDIDLMRWYLGSEVTEVYAAGTTVKHPEFRQYGDTETGMAMLKFDNGAVGLLHVGRTAPHGYHTETEIVCTEAHLRIGGVPWKNRVAVFDANGAVQPIVEDFPERFAEAYLREMTAFVDCVRTHRHPEVTVYDGTRAVEVSYAITESFRTGMPVKPDNR